MTRNLFIFLGTFVAGALIALVARAAMFTPHQDDVGHPAGGGEYPAMVSNALAPAQASEKSATPATSAQPVNTVCAICGMEVNPKLPTLEYRGKTIGFGCQLCAPKFKADPDRYGPSYLRNEVIER